MASGQGQPGANAHGIVEEDVFDNFTHHNDDYFGQEQPVPLSPEEVADFYHQQGWEPPAQGVPVVEEPALAPEQQFAEAIRGEGNTYFTNSLFGQDLMGAGEQQLPEIPRSSYPPVPFNNHEAGPSNWTGNNTIDPQLLHLDQGQQVVDQGLPEEMNILKYVAPQVQVDAGAIDDERQIERTLWATPAPNVQEDAFQMDIDERVQIEIPEDVVAMDIDEQQQQQMENPVNAQQEQDPLQIQQETRPRTRGTRPPAQEKAGWEYFVTNGKLDCKELRAARYTKTQADYGNDKRAGAKLQNTSHKADVKNEMQNEVVALVQSICEMSSWDADASPLGFVLIPYKHRVHDKAHITGQGAPSKNTLAAWKTKEEKRKHRFQVWQLASFWAHRTGQAPPVNGEHMKKELVKDEDWQRSLEASSIPIPEWLAQGPQ